VLGGLAAGRAGFAAVLPVALAESRGAPDAALAAARLAVLDELDPDRRTAAGRARWAQLGPYFGFLGPVAGGADPRAGDPAVTTLEGLAGCGWQTFLRRLLRLEPAPDPLAGVPALDPTLAGALVHKVLQGVVERGAGAPPLPSDLPRALSATPRPVRWPAAPELAALVATAAAEAARGAGLVLPGFGDLLARRAQPLLEAAAGDWAGGAALPVVGVEVEERLALASPARRRIVFKADRVERLADRVRLTDYKSGRPRLLATEGRRRLQLLREVAGGSRLQAAAYALAVGERAEGRYLFLGPNPEETPREGALDNRDAALVRAFQAALGTLFTAWELGTFFPRLVDPAKGTEPARCGWCEVREACLRRDSGARRRLVEWAAAHASAEAAPSGDEGRALLALWRLPLGETVGETAAEEEK